MKIMRGKARRSKKYYLEMLVDYCVKRQLWLMEKSEIAKFWRSEIDCMIPPVLWFGDLSGIYNHKCGNRSKREPILLTIGLNPSWHEYYKDKNTAVPENRLKLYRCEKCQQCGKRRQCELCEQYCDTLQNVNIDELMDGYNDYFKKGSNPYTKWFGKEVEPYCVECFIRGLDASYYVDRKSKSKYKYRAIHVDLFPFATKDGYSHIVNSVEKDIFQSGFSKRVLSALIHVINPEIIVFCSSGVYDKFKEYVCPIAPSLCYERELVLGENEIKENNSLCKKVKVMNHQYLAIVPAFNLGNPKGGYNKEKLRKLGVMASLLK